MVMTAELMIIADQSRLLAAWLQAGKACWLCAEALTAMPIDGGEGRTLVCTKRIMYTVVLQSAWSHHCH